MGQKLKVSQCCVVLVAIFDIANATTTSTKTTTTSTKTKAVILGGGDGGHNGYTEFWPNTQTDCSVDNLPEEPFYSRSAVINGSIIYLCGGDCFPETGPGGCDICHVSDLALDGSWHPLSARLNQPRSEFSLINMDSLFVAIGGYDGGYLATLEVFDGQAWTLLPFNLTTQRYAHCSVRISENEILVLGGGNTDSVELVDIMAGTSEYFTSMTKKRSYTGCTFNLEQNRVYVSGGLLTSTLVEYLDLNTRQWGRIANLGTGRDSHVMDYIDGRLTVFGGSSPDGSSSVYQSSVEQYNDETDEWIEAEPLAVPRSSHAMVTTNC